MGLSSTEEIACMSAYKFLAELSLLGYPSVFLKKSIYALTKKWKPSILINNLLNFLKRAKEADTSLVNIALEATKSYTSRTG